MEKDFRGSTKLKSIFDALNDFELNYNWLITDYQCYPQTLEYDELFREQKPIWMTGEELRDMINYEDFQWIWGAFSGFKKNIGKEEVFSYDIPLSEKTSIYFEKPLSTQNPLSDIEIIAVDSTLTLFLSNDKKYIRILKESFPLSEIIE